MAEIAARFRHFEETESAGLLVALGSWHSTSWSMSRC